MVVLELLLRPIIIILLRWTVLGTMTRGGRWFSSRWDGVASIQHDGATATVVVVVVAGGGECGTERILVVSFGRRFFLVGWFRVSSSSSVCAMIVRFDISSLVVVWCCNNDSGWSTDDMSVPNISTALLLLLDG